MKTVIAGLVALALALPLALPAADIPPLKQYWLVVLKQGPNRDHDAATAQRIQKEHMAYMAATHADGKLLIAGPFGDDGDWRGLLVYDVPGRAEAEALCAGDPAVLAGRLVCDIRPWWSQPGASLR